MKVLGLISDAFEKIAIVLSTAILIAVFCLVFSGVVFRIIGHNFSLSEELSRWGLISLCFIGASVALKKKQHVGVNMLMQALPLRLARIFIAIAYIVVFILLVFSTFYSVKAALAAKGMVGDIIPVSMMYVKFSLPIGMSMMFVHLVYGFFGIFKAKDVNSILIGT